MEAQERKSLKATTYCFHRALRNLGIEKKDIKARAKRRNEVSVEYRRIVRTMSTKMLELILEEHHNNIMPREDSTIHEILDELANRILLRDNNDQNIRDHARSLP